jgi:hypothetical protein
MKLFSFVENEDDSRDIIELVSCQWNGDNCSELRPQINRLLRSARKSRLNKEYRKAIDEIVEAFYLTDRNTLEGCRGCTDFFRETMLNSVILITAELKRMSGGVFRKKRYTDVYLYASEKVDELCRHHQSKKGI